MNLNKTLRRILVLACLPLLLAACERGPLEKAGRTMDRAAEKTGDKINGVLK